MKKYSIVLWLLLLVTAELWILSKGSFSEITEQPIKSIAQITALLGAVGYFFTFVLSSRLPFIEKEFSLDKAYKLHRLVGTIAGSGILLHVSSLIANSLPSPFSFKLYLVPGQILSYTLGIIAFYLLLFMLISVLYLRLPYPLWKLGHKITSYSVIFATLHIFQIPSDVSNFLPLRIWILGIAALAVTAWAYRQFIYSWSSFRHRYQVRSSETVGDITMITLQNLSNPLKASPGQFAFFKFLQRKNGPTSEVHPFTILESTNRELVIAIKALGDNTSRFAKLALGTPVLIAGPHGTFGQDLISTKSPSVWIAGGIGITPFYHAIKVLAETKQKKQADFLYLSTEADVIFHPTLLQLTQDIGVSYTYRCTSTEGRIAPEQYLRTLALPAKDYNYFLSGPQGLLEATKMALKKAGVPRAKIHTEDFDFISLSLA